MPAELNATIHAATALPVSLVVTLIIAAAALITVGIVVRRLRFHGKLTFANASTSAATAALIMATALLASVSLGASTTAAAETVHPAFAANTVVVHVPIESNQPLVLDGTDLDGYQLPTK